MDLVAGLERVLAAGADNEGAVESLVRLSGGASRETWSFDLRRRDGTVVPLILRRDPPGSLRTGGMGLEARLLQEADRAGVPVPRVLFASDDPAVLGSSFVVMERLEGETIPRRILREPSLASARSALAGECGAVLATLHCGMDPSRVPGLEPQDPLTQYREVLDAIGWPSPTFEMAFRWLEINRPSANPRSVVHGDFRNGNLIVGPSGLQAVLDWEMAHIGDPLEDLSWLCVKSWRFGVDLPVGGFGTYDDLVDAYEGAGGGPVDRSALHWWEVLGNLKWGVICMMQASAHTSGAIRSVELAAIGRRVCEVEWDLVELLAPHAGEDRAREDAAGEGGAGDGNAGGDPWSVDPDAPPAGLYGQPDARGLVEAAREFVERDVMAATDGRVRFHARIAVNVLRMVERELVAGPAHRAAHAAGLAGLGVGTEEELAAAIRAGNLAGREAELASFLRAVVRAKLEVAHPSYLEGPRPPS